jgi:hypothetical protein
MIQVLKWVSTSGARRRLSGLVLGHERERVTVLWSDGHRTTEWADIVEAYYEVVA